MVHAAGGGRLKVIATNAAVNQGTDVVAIDPRNPQRLVATQHALLAGHRTAFPEPPLTNTGNQLQATLGQAQSLVQRRQTLFDLLAGDDFLGQRVAE